MLYHSPKPRASIYNINIMIIDKITMIINVLICSGFTYAATHLPSERHIRKDTKNNFTLNQYIGVWYQVAVMYPTSVDSEVICEWFNITAKDNCEGCFDEIYRLSLDGKSTTRFYGYGTVVDSQIRVTFLGSGTKARVLAVTSYHGGEELILHDLESSNNFELVSRRPRVQVEVKSEFEKLAKDRALHIIYVNHEVCRI